MAIELRRFPRWLVRVFREGCLGRTFIVVMDYLNIVVLFSFFIYD